MRELNGHTGIRQLLRHHGLCPGFLLKRDDIVGKFIFLGVISHIEQTKRHLTQTSVCHIVVAALDDAADQFIGEGFSRLVMEGEGAQELLFDGEVLHELRGQFDKVPPHIRATQTLETGVGKHAVQRMTELVEEGLYFAQRQEGWFLFRRLGEIHHHTDMRTDILALAVDPLTLVFRHPCPTLLALARMEVGIEDSQK